MIKEIPTLDTEIQNFYIKMLESLALEDQKRLVTKIIAIEGDLNKIPYLLDNERKRDSKRRNGIQPQKKRREKNC